MYIVTIRTMTIEELPAGKDWELTGLDEPKYAYTPEIMKKKEIERQVYSQIVEELDVFEVIQAVNKKH